LLPCNVISERGRGVIESKSKHLNFVGIFFLFVINPIEDSIKKEVKNEK